MHPPRLDHRSHDHVYERALALARATLPSWALGFGPAPDYFSPADVGLTLFKLFAELHGKLAGPLNGIPDKYALAFWDFLGTTLRAPTAAEAPLVFTPATWKAAHIPSETQVIVTGQPNIVFETRGDLALLPVSIEAAYAVRPAADAVADYTDRVGGQGDPFPLFVDDPAQQPIVHALHMGDSQLDFSGLQGSLTITLEGVNLYQRFFGDWSNVHGVSVRPQFSFTAYDTLTITFADLPVLPHGSVNGTPGYWLSVAPKHGVRIFGFQQEILPQIYSVLATLTLTAVPPDNAFFNSRSVDLKKGGQPFGSTPAIQDAFYLGSQDCFLKIGAAITLNVSVAAIDPPEPAILEWEYWDGTAWRAIADVLDTTNNFTQTGAVTFTCPEIFESKVNDKPGYWIRVRLVDGGYGSAPSARVTKSAQQVVDDVLGPYISERTAAIYALKKQGINFGFQYAPASYTPPFIQALTIDCVSMKQPDTLLAQNGFVYTPLESAPYIPCVEQEPTFYLGLGTKNFEKEVAARPLMLFFATAAAADPGLLPQTRESVLASVATGTPSPGLQLSYLSNDQAWTPLYAVNLKNDARAEGIISVNLPAQFKPAALFGQELHWLRVTPPAQPDYQVPDMVGIFVNAIPAFNAVAHRNVILGSSTGEPGQTFQFPSAPVLNGAIVDVLEPISVAPLYVVDGLDPTGGVASGTTADIKMGWQVWTEVSNFDFSGPGSRDFELDHATGALTFGDGVHGMTPPQGTNNIRARFYESGGGEIGNVPTGKLNALHKANPAVKSVANVLPAAGGLGADQINQLRQRAPDQIKTQDRAVACPDFASLAITSSQQVARSICAVDERGRIVVSILPSSTGQTPLPNFDLLDKVAQFLRARCLPLMRDLVLVRGPDYIKLDAAIAVVPGKSASQSTLQSAIGTAFDRFLNPLTGGTDGTGWTFGCRVHASGLARIVGKIEGVVMVESVTFDEDRSSAGFTNNQLPRPGALTIGFIDADTV